MKKTNFKRLLLLLLTAMFSGQMTAQSFNIFVKKESSTVTPKIHAWTNDSGKDVAITNTANWPANLPAMAADTDGWFKYTTTAKSVGVLFRFGTAQSIDFKYYTQSVWILLDASGAKKSVSFTDPRISTADVVFSTTVEPKFEGCFVEGQQVLAGVSTTTPNGVVYYTIDGTDPIPNVGSTAIGYGSIYLSALTRIKAVVYVNGVRVSQIFTKDYCFKKGIVTISTNPLPNSSGKFTAGQPVTVTLTSNLPDYPIWYSTDGQTPYLISQSKKVYTTSFEVTTDSNISAWIPVYEDYRYGRYSDLVTKVINFEAVNPVPTFTYNTTPWLNENGKYNAGANVVVTFSATPTNPDWDIYYSLDGNDVDLTRINSGVNSLNPIRYSGPFTVTSDKIVYAKQLNVKTGQNQGVSPMVFAFEQPKTEYTIYVKREGTSTEAPKVHVWSKETGVDVAITNTANWPNNLTTMSHMGNNWYTYTVTKSVYGCLFKYSDVQTADFKYYSKNVWILLDASGKMKSITDTMPTDTNIVLKATPNVLPKANGKYDIGQTVTMTFESNGGAYKRYIAYTTDGSDPKTSTTYKLLMIGQYTPATLDITTTTNLRAIEEGMYRSGPYSNEVGGTIEFEIPSQSIVAITKDIQPKANGKYDIGQVVNVKISRTQGCGGCSYFDFYTLDGSDPKTSPTKIAGSAEVNLPVTGSITIRAISYPSMGSSTNYTEQSLKIEFEAPTSFKIWVRRESVAQQNPRIHVWSKSTGTDVAITNAASWPNNLPNMSQTGGGWYFYTVDKPVYGCLFKYSDVQTADIKYYSKDIWVVLDATGKVKIITDGMPVAAKEDGFENTTSQFVITPNPVSENFTVDFSSGISEAATVTIYSGTGQVIFTETTNAATTLQKQFSAQALGLRSGLYILNIQTATTNVTKRFVVE